MSEQDDRIKPLDLTAPVDDSVAVDDSVPTDDSVPVPPKEPTAQPIEQDARAVPLKGGVLPEGMEYVNPFTEGEAKPDEDPHVAPINPELVQEVLQTMVLQALEAVETATDKETQTIEAAKLAIGVSLLETSGKQIYQDVLKHTKAAQYIEAEGRKLGCNTVTPTQQSGKLYGAQAIQQIKSRTHTSREKIQRLPKSGFNVVIGFISEREKLNLAYRLVNLVHDVGADTNGLLLSFDDAHVQIAITDFALDHIVNCSVIGWDRTWIQNHLLPADLPVLHAATLAALYPSGYPFFRSCIHRELTEAGCNWKTIMDDMNDLSNVARLDFSLISHFKSEHMTRNMRLQLGAAANTTKPEDVVAYQAVSNPTVRLGPFKDDGQWSWYVDTKQPSYAQFRKEANYWIDGLRDLIEEVLMTSPVLSEDEDQIRRTNVYNTYLNRSRFEFFASYITSVIDVHNETGEETEYARTTPDDHETIFAILDTFAGDEDVVDTAVNLLAEHVFKSQWGFTALPDFTCPSCQRNQRQKHDTLNGFVFFNVTNYFFESMKKAVS